MLLARQFGSWTEVFDSRHRHTGVSCDDIGRLAGFIGTGNAALEQRCAYE